MDMDGSNSKILLSNSKIPGQTIRKGPLLGWPNDIIIDRLSNSASKTGNWSDSPFVYFCDAKFDYIARTNLEFTEFTTIFTHGQIEAHVFSISLFEDLNSYWKFLSLLEQFLERYLNPFRYGLSDQCLGMGGGQKDPPRYMAVLGPN